MSSLPSFTVVSGPLAAVVAAGRRGPDVVVVGVRPDDEGGQGGDGLLVGPQARALAASLGVDLDRRIGRAAPTGRAGEVTELQVDRDGSDVERLLLVGLGDGSSLAHRRSGAALARRTRGARRVVVGSTLRTDGGALRAFVEGWGLAAYTFSRKTSKRPAPAAAVELVLDRPADTHAEALRRALVTVDAVHLARDLANTPSSEKSPAWLARRAEKVAATGRLRVTVRDERRLAAEGFGGLVAVGAGSATPPRLVELRYRPRAATPTTPHVVLVGKGITFDTGGLSLKPSDGMVAMKTDMSGAATVIAVMSALDALDVGVCVTGLIAAAENMPSGSAYRPGDVITQYGGTTVEVFNTDAEGRLVLADALAYADRRLAPDAVVDIATLTGAATLGLGRRHAALYANDDRLASALDAAADDSGERVWRMPLEQDYRASLDSDVADIAHIALDKKIQGGSITAALFLREFVGEYPWAHLDIAGPGRSDGDEHEVTRGATGWGTRTLLRWLESPRPVVRRRA